MPRLNRINRLNKVAFKGRLRDLTLQVGHADLTDADTQQQIDFASDLPDACLVIGAYAEVTTAMSGGSVSACTADVGVKTLDTDAFLDAVDIFTGAAAIGNLPKGTQSPGYFAGGTPTVIVDSTGDNLVNLTAGDVTFHVLYYDLGYAEL